MCLYNPVEEYLYDTGRWDGKDRIRALADLVPCHNPHWQELFYRWFWAWWHTGVEWTGNTETILLLCLSVLKGWKSTRILLPPELRFGYTDSIDFKSRQEAERSLGRFLLVNIDEFDKSTSTSRAS